jgi:methyl-accepting chemotaxis protein
MTTGMILLSCAIVLVASVAFLRNAVHGEKQLQTREFVNIGLSVLEYYHEMAQQGTLTREQAQDTAKQAIKAMTFGENNQDYYWINDFHPRMIMHPPLARCRLPARPWPGLKPYPFEFWPIV